MATSIKVSLRPAHGRVVEQFMDTAGVFRRSDLAKSLYPLTNPRSLKTAEKLAEMAMNDLARAGRIKRHGHVHWAKVVAARTLLDGNRVPELDRVIEVKLSTKCPQKWLAVDGETGAVWAADANGRWVSADKQQRALLALALGKK